MFTYSSYLFERMQNYKDTAVKSYKSANDFKEGKGHFYIDEYNFLPSIHIEIIDNIFDRKDDLRTLLSDPEIDIF